VQAHLRIKAAPRRETRATRRRQHLFAACHHAYYVFEGLAYSSGIACASLRAAASRQQRHARHRCKASPRHLAHRLAHRAAATLPPLYVMPVPAGDFARLAAALPSGTQLMLPAARGKKAHRQP